MGQKWYEPLTANISSRENDILEGFIAEKWMIEFLYLAPPCNIQSWQIVLV